MGKTVIAPVIGFIVILVKAIFGIEIPDDVVAQVIDSIVMALSTGAVVYGIVKNHKKDK